MMAARICQCTKNQCTVHLKWMTCIVYKSYLNKVAKNKRDQARMMDKPLWQKAKQNTFFKGGWKNTIMKESELHLAQRKDSINTEYQ